MISDARERFQALKADGVLPSPRGLAVAIARLASREETDAGELVRLVKSDPAMAGRLLKYANAAHAGTRRHLVSLSQAVVFLGMFRIRHLALAFSLLDQYRSGACLEFDYPAYWRQSVACALACERLGPRAQVPAEDSFTCGLLSGVGRLALATAFPRQYAAILRRHPDPAALLDAEVAEFGIDHLALSAELMEDWGLPPIFAAVVRFHEYPEQAAFATGSRAESLVHVLHLAYLVSVLLERGPGDEAYVVLSQPAIHHAAARVGLDAAELQSLVAELSARWTEWCAELDLPPTPDAGVFRRSPVDLLAAESATVAGMRVGLVGERGSASADEVALWLERLGAEVVWVAGLPFSLPQPEIVFIDLSGERPWGEVLDAVRLWRQVVGHERVFLIGLVPADCEAKAGELVDAGADDYLPLPANPVALATRLRSAQKVVALQHLVRAEREVAIKQADVWARASRRMLHEALTDPLTQIPNRRFGEDSLGEEWGQAIRSGAPLACIMVDIDHFKAVNDQYGHELGDVVLRQVAAILQMTCRKNDVVFRYGGEEFCVICPAARREDALALAERIIAAVAEFAFGPQGAIRLTVSAGVACRASSVAESASAEALVARADAALYEAKHAGRNRVVMKA